MTDETQAHAEQIGWTVTDPDGNVVASGGITIAEADALVGEMLAQLADAQGGQE